MNLYEGLLELFFLGSFFVCLLCMVYHIGRAFLAAHWQGICLIMQEMWFDPWVGKIPWRSKWQPTPVFLPGESRGQRRLAGYSPWYCKELDMIEVT